jgi:prophage regulatory protein
MQSANPLIMRMKDVQRTVSLSRSSIYNKVNERSRYFDVTFPKPVKLGSSAVGWISVEIYQWIAQKSDGRPKD